MSKMLEEMQGNSMPTLHGIVAGLMTGEYDTGSNWDLVEHVLDNLKVEGVGHNLEFYNGLLEALWFFGQGKRATKVLQEARKRGVFVEAFRKTRMMWAIDVHRFVKNTLLFLVLLPCPPLPLHLHHLGLICFCNDSQDVDRSCTDSSYHVAA